MDISKVLIVDDSLLGRVSIRNVIAPMGLDIIEAEDGYGAIRKIKNENPDLVFLDLLMPKKDGFEVLTELKEKNISANVIIVSADIQNTTRKKCLEAGAVGFLNKPFDKDELDILLNEISKKV